MSVCLSVSKLKFFIFLAQIFKQLVREHSEHKEHLESNQRGLRDDSEINQSIKIRVIQSEPINTASCFYKNALTSSGMAIIGYSSHLLLGFCGYVSSPQINLVLVRVVKLRISKTSFRFCRLVRITDSNF